MTARLLLDEHFSPRLADRLRKEGLEVVAVAGHPVLGGAEDETVLAWATHERCCLLTENVRDFMLLYRRTLERGEVPAGILFTSARSFPRSVDGIGRLVWALVAALDQLRLPAPGMVMWL